MPHLKIILLDKDYSIRFGGGGDLRKNVSVLTVLLQEHVFACMFCLLCVHRLRATVVSCKLVQVWLECFAVEKLEAPVVTHACNAE